MRARLNNGYINIFFAHGSARALSIWMAGALGYLFAHRFLRASPANIGIVLLLLPSPLYHARVYHR